MLLTTQACSGGLAIDIAIDSVAAAFVRLSATRANSGMHLTLKFDDIQRIRINQYAKGLRIFILAILSLSVYRRNR